MIRTAALTLCTFLLLAPVAAAQNGAHDGGEGWIGETNDKIVTNFGFILIAFFPLFIFFMSLLQHALDKRKYARKAAAKAMVAKADRRGGW